MSSLAIVYDTAITPTCTTTPFGTADTPKTPMTPLTPMTPSANRYHGQHSWALQGAKLQEMLCADTAVFFASPMFSMASLSWQIVHCPNGCESQNRGSFDVFLKLTSKPLRANKI